MVFTRPGPALYFAGVFPWVSILGQFQWELGATIPFCYYSMILSETQFRIPTSGYKTASMKSQAKGAPDALNQRLYQNLSLAAALETQSSQGLT